MSNSRQQEVVDKIRQYILHGIFPGGQRLIETDLSQRLNISRTPIREALIALAEERLIEYRENKGYIVRIFELAEIMERSTVRSALEGLACKIIIQKGMSPELKRGLSACLAEGDAILSKDEITEGDTFFWSRMNDQFHNLIIEATENETLIQTFKRVTRIPYAPKPIEWLTGDGNRQPFESFHAEHHQLVKAMLDSDSNLADKLMQSHILTAADYMSERVEASREIAEPRTAHRKSSTKTSKVASLKRAIS